jgi:hypothetical protein
MAETETPYAEPVGQNEKGAPAPEAGQEPARKRHKGLLWGGAIAALLAIVTMACLCLSGIFWLQSRSSESTVVTLLNQAAPVPLVEGEAVQAPAPQAEEAVQVPEGALLALEQLPMVQPEVAAAVAEAPQALGLRAAGPALPTIEYFWADPSSVNPGQCSTLRWGAVLGATWAGIEPAIGGVGAPGTTVVCPGGTTTYILTAQGAGGQSYASTTVSVGAGPDKGTVVLQSEGPLDGYRSNDGRGSKKNDILAANAEINPAVGEVVWRGFMSFDLSAIPRQRAIKGAELRFFQVRVGGDPYGKLGRLILEHVAYGNQLDDAAYYVVPMDSFALAPQTQRKTWYVVTAPMLREWIAQDRAEGRSSFQVRLRWEQETDGDGKEDYVSIESPENFFGTGNAPKLTVTYGP